MSNSKHTPAPWVNDNGLVAGRCRKDNKLSSFDIFDASQWWGDEEEGQANAALIAASPQLLATLERVQRNRRYIMQAMEDRWSDEVYEEVRTMFLEVDSVLRNAHGKEAA
jgi:hypothetical protein